MKKISHILLTPLVLLGFILASSLQGFGQTPEIDSLRQVIASQADSREKVDNMILLSRKFYLSGYYDSVLKVVTPALKIAEQIPYQVGIADAYYMQSSTLKMKRELSQALALTDHYLEIFISLQDSLRLARGYFNLGTLYLDLEEYDLSIYYCQKSLSYSIPLHEPSLILGSYNCLGRAFVNGNARYDSAAHYYLKAIETIENSGIQNYYTLVLNL
jgi:tetratricopeptide (TPR) repeat protein